MELFDDVPLAKSSRSTSAVRRPRVAASSATPAPVIPPPTTSTSNSSSRSRSSIVVRSNAAAAIAPMLGLGTTGRVNAPRLWSDPAPAMTITYDPKHAAYLDEADVRGEMTRVFDVCDGCRRCVTLCPSFPSLFEMIAGGRWR